VAERLDAILSQAARKEPTYLDFLDEVLGDELDAKQKKRVAMGIQIAHFPTVLFGPPGVGKTHLAIGLGRAVVDAGHSVLFITATSLIGSLAKAEAEGRLPEQIGFFAKPKLLIVDELGYLPFEKRSANLFFQLVTRRYERGSMLITTNQMVTQWGQVFGDEMIAAAVLDRILHHSHVLVVQGESYRLKNKKRAGLVARSAG
jgi:DNA replication protein DnaC